MMMMMMMMMMKLQQRCESRSQGVLRVKENEREPGAWCMVVTAAPGISTSTCVTQFQIQMIIINH